jgi:hypothetical protein
MGVEGRLERRAVNGGWEGMEGKARSGREMEKLNVPGKILATSLMKLV